MLLSFVRVHRATIIIPTPTSKKFQKKMKKGFELCIFLSQVDHLLHLDETIEIIKKPSAELFELMDLNHRVNQSSLNVVKDYMYRELGINYFDHIERLYFGQETCENLIPTVNQLQKVYEYCTANEYDFTFVTPYVAPKGILKLYECLDYLNSLQDEIEVVVNDYGVLHTMVNKYPNLVPTLGRLLTKLKRDPRFTISGYDTASSEIKKIKVVEKNQQQVVKTSSLDMKVYQDFLKEKGVTRVGIDSVPQGLDSKILKKWGFPVDLYWPWTYSTSGRNCAIAAYTQPGKLFHPTDEPCHFQCREFEFALSSDKRMFKTVQRGNAVWIDSESLWKDNIGSGFDRLVYQPYIPI